MIVKLKSSPNVYQQSLHLSEESTDNESKTKSASLAHRDSTLPENDLDASYHDEDDDAFVQYTKKLSIHNSQSRVQSNYLTSRLLWCNY